MEVNVIVSCQRSLSTFDRCVPLAATLETGSVHAWAAEAIKTNGWTLADGMPFCPRHDPAQQGEIVQVGVQYVEIAPGVRVRLTHGQFGDTFPFEVLREPVS